MAFNGDITVAAGEQADVVLVTGGTATIAGDVETARRVRRTGRPPGRDRSTSVFVTGGSVSIDAGDDRHR